MNYYKRNIGDISRDLSNLSQGAMGAYDLLMDWYYANEKPLPADQEDIYNITRARTKDERKNAAKARAFFDANGRHERCDEEIAKYRAQAEANRVTAEAREEKKRATNRARTEHESCTNGSPSAHCEPSHKPLEEQEHKELPPTAEREALSDEDALKLMIDGAVEYMRTASVAPKQARSVIGLLRKNVADDLIVSEILATMQQQRIAEPLAWLVKAAQSRKAVTHATPAHRESASERVARINAEAEAREARDYGATDHATD